MKRSIPLLLAVFLFLATQLSHAAIRYEYLVVSGEDILVGYDEKKTTIEKFINAKLNELGKDGWELVQIDRRPSNTQFNFSAQYGSGNINISTTPRFFFKRELNAAEQGAAANP